jgi:Cysteine dioxygenase type I
MTAATRIAHKDLAFLVLAELLGDRSGLIERARALVVPAAGRAWECVFDTPDADAWLIAWNPASHVGSHDHGGSRGAVHVLQGALVESYRANPAARVERVRLLESEATVGIPEDRVHDVANRGSGLAVSLHVYAPRLTTMTYYPNP